MRRWDKQPPKQELKNVMDRRQLILGTITLMALAVLLIVGLTPRTASAPESDPEAQQADSASGVVLAADCQVVQHLIYTPCGHDLTRRQTLPSELVGKTREAAQAVYDRWQITSFSPMELCMEQTLAMYCPEHVVLLPDDSGMLCVFENRYGDALALVRELATPLTALPAAEQETVRTGKGFNTLAELESWLESIES